MLLVNSGGESALQEWRMCVAQFLPNLRVEYLNDPNIDREAVEYVLVYNPPPGRLSQFPNLRLVLSAGAGVDHITRDPTWPRHLQIVRMGGSDTAQRMNEYVALAALSLLRGMRRVAIAQAECRWDHFETSHSAPNVRLGVMGLGNLGSGAAVTLSRLGFRVSGWSQTPKRIEGIDCYSGVAERDLFLSRSDILVCLLPDTPETHGIIDRRAISLLPRGAGIINVARGSHLVTEDLVAALDNGHLSGAVLDVFEPEPLLPSSPLWQHPKILITPHIGALASRLERARYVADVIGKFESGLPLSNVYDPVRGY